MKDALNFINIWFINNKLTLNLNKTTFITFGSYQNSLPNANFTVNISNHSVNRVYSCKYLGIYFDQFMRWDPQVNYKIKRVKYLKSVFLTFLCKDLMKSLEIKNPATRSDFKKFGPRDF